MAQIYIFPWSLYTTAIPQADLTGSTTGVELLGQDITYNGGTGVNLNIDDDDTDFEDGYVETGGPQTLIDPVTIGPTTYPVGSVVENEFGLIDASGNAYFIVRIDGVNVGIGYASGDPPTVGEVINAVDARDGDAADSTDGISTTTPYTDIMCFAHDTLIETDTICTPVQELQVGDRVRTLDHGMQTIRWIGTRRVRAIGKYSRVIIKRGTFGNTRDLRLSRKHRILVTGWRAELLFGEFEVLVEAEHLVNGDTVFTQDGGFETYHHLLLDRHEILFAEGAPTESLSLGESTREAMTAGGWQEITGLFPELDTSEPAHGKLARHCLRKYEALLLASH